MTLRLPRMRLPKVRLTTASLIWLICNGAVAILGGLLFYLGGEKTFIQEGDQLVAKADQNVQALGISLLATAVAGIALVGYVLISDSTRERIHLLWDVGFRDIFHKNTSAIAGQYSARFNASPREIDVLGTGLDKLRSDFSEQFELWGRRSKVRFLILDPGYPPNQTVTIAEQRDREESNPGDGITGQVRELLRDTAKARASFPNSFIVRKYKCLPTLTMVRIDDELFWAPYLAKKRASSTPTLLLRRGGVLYDTLLQHFESIWNDPELSEPA